MYCKKCGTDMGNSDTCPSCGTPANNSQQPVVVNVVNSNTNANINQNTNINGYGHYLYKSKWKAFFLCLFLGVFGVHRFYVGKTGTGILWLITLGLGCIGWLFDLIMILTGSFRDKAGYPLR